jgi:hypothetical protein
MKKMFEIDIRRCVNLIIDQQYDFRGLEFISFNAMACQYIGYLKKNELQMKESLKLIELIGELNK